MSIVQLESPNLFACSFYFSLSMSKPTPGLLCHWGSSCFCHCSCYVAFCPNGASLYSPYWHVSCCAGEASLKFVEILLLWLPDCWDYRYRLLCPTLPSFFFPWTCQVPCYLKKSYRALNASLIQRGTKCGQTCLYHMGGGYHKCVWLSTHEQRWEREGKGPLFFSSSHLLSLSKQMILR